MPHPDGTFEPRARAVCVALILCVSCAIPMIAVAHDGTWAQLGVPLRLGSPLLRDDAGQRLVLIGADAVANTPTLLDAWEFRESSGWRRIDVPEPPYPGPSRSMALHADPAHARFVAIEYTNGTLATMRMRLWALELGPPAGWRALDEVGAPLGTLHLDPGGEAAWVFTGYPLRQLWKRSLADSGQWRMVRELPEEPGYFEHRGVDVPRDRVLALGRRLASSDSVVAWTLSLADTSGWTEMPRSAPWPRWPATSVTVSDTPRDRLLLLAWEDSGGLEPASWALDLAGASGWTSLGPLLDRNPGASLAAWGDSLWAWGRDSNAERARLTAIPLAAPASARVAYEAVRPGYWQFELAVHDPIRSRSLFLGGVHAGTDAGIPLDSLYELRQEGQGVHWRMLPVAGPGPHEFGSRTWTFDEPGATVYLLHQTDSTESGVEHDEVWGLHLEDSPRWSLVWSGGAPAPGLWGRGLVFDPDGRRLIRFGAPNADGTPSGDVWALDVDDPQGWGALAIEGSQAPYHVEASSVVLDPIRERVVYRGLVAGSPGALGSLELAARPRWLGSSLRCDPIGTRNCIPQYTTGLFDPIGRRVLQFGGYSMVEMTSYDDLWAVDSGDTLGPLRRLNALGSPGRRGGMPAAYDSERDALVTFDFYSGGLYEFRFDRGQAVHARLASANARADRNRLRWSSAPGTSFRLWRRTAQEPWAQVADIVASSAGELSFDDRAIESGTRYGYRLTASPSALEPAAADVWLTSATTASFALAPPWPNPARDALNLAFTLAATAPVDLEVFDVAGRRVWSRRWAAPAPGPHHVAIAPAELPRSGLYFLRLRQSGLTATRRVVFAP